MVICLNSFTIPKEYQSNYTLMLYFHILLIVTVDELDEMVIFIKSIALNLLLPT